MKYRVILLFLGFSLAGSFSAPAALTWESKDADLHPSITDKTAIAHFKYKNTGDKPVKITSVHASCGCTTAALKKDVVDPKESGEITATFNIGGRSGVQTKTITVVTDDEPLKPTILTLKATIPQLLDVQPIFLFWSANDELKPKTITVEVGNDFPVKKLNVTSTDKSISTQVEPVPDKKEFKIIVKPTEAGRPINAALRIEPDYPKGSAKPYFANLRIDSRAVMPK
ncbi:MAG TPA: DUF1573 domain-containing protein [Chthoniobacterales bacterium]